MREALIARFLDERPHVLPSLHGCLAVPVLEEAADGLTRLVGDALDGAREQLAGPAVEPEVEIAQVQRAEQRGQSRLELEGLEVPLSQTRVAPPDASIGGMLPGWTETFGRRAGQQLARALE